MKKEILIVTADYYKDIADNLLLGATVYLDKEIKKLSKLFDYKYDYLKAPGCFEIPYLIHKNKDKFDGFIALGCIIKGETYHFELISNEVTRKIMDLSISINKPIGFGVLACNNMEQAKERSDPFTFKLNKGKEAAKACFELLIAGPS